MKIVSTHGHAEVAERPDRHEKRDAHTRPIWWFLFGLFVFIIASIFLMLALYRFFAVPPAAFGPQPSALLPDKQVPPSPQLQTRPQRDMYEMRRHEEEVLSTYGWVDQKAGVARIPIDRAIDILAQRGLPARSEGQK